MITAQEFRSGKVVYYSSFGDKEYCKLKLLKITKKRGRVFWFDAEILDNDKLRNCEFNQVGSVHSYSNSFIYNTLNELMAGTKRYVDVQVRALKSYYKLCTGHELTA